MGKLRIACIGQSGQTALALKALGREADDIEIVHGGRPNVDLCARDTMERFLDHVSADAVINAGAYNFVDKAETDEAAAFAANAEGPKQLAKICRARGMSFIHMSTDCVFDGRSSNGYTEDDAPAPLSVYGRSKLAGEQAVLSEDPSALVMRVCWVYSRYGSNFVSKMIELAGVHPELRVVSDQIGTPTYAPDIARALVAATRLRAEDTSLVSGLLHVSGAEVMSRSDMARAILEASEVQAGPSVPILPVSTLDFAAAAERPMNAILLADRARAMLDFVPTPFEQGLRDSVSGILENMKSD